MASPQLLPQPHPFSQARDKGRPSGLGPHLTPSIQGEVVDHVIGVVDHLDRQGPPAGILRQEPEPVSKIEEDRRHLGQSHAGGVVDQDRRPHEGNRHVFQRAFHQGVGRLVAGLDPGLAAIGQKGADELPAEGCGPVIEGVVRHPDLADGAKQTTNRGQVRSERGALPSLSVPTATRPQHARTGVAVSPECAPLWGSDRKDARLRAGHRHIPRTSPA
ncbi:hypothetical protein D3C80_1211790 [compost metagenome]